MIVILTSWLSLNVEELMHSLKFGSPLQRPNLSHLQRALKPEQVAIIIATVIINNDLIQHRAGTLLVI